MWVGTSLQLVVFNIGLEHEGLSDLTMIAVEDLNPGLSDLGWLSVHYYTILTKII